MLLGKHQPASRPLQIQAMVSYLATKKSRGKFSKVLLPLRRLHVFMCLSLLEAEVSPVFSWVEDLNEVLAAARGMVGEVALPCGVSRGCLELSRCSCPLKDVCGMSVHTSTHQRQSVLTVQWSRLSLSSGKLSHAVVTPPDGTADILLEIPNNSLLKPIFQALI